MSLAYPEDIFNRYLKGEGYLNVKIEDLYQAFKERLRAEENDLIPSDEFKDKE